MKLPRLWAGLAVALVLGACGGDDGATDEVRPFDEIATTEPVIEFDPSGTAATLRVTTDLDAVCAVAYGIDAPSGAIATDSDMDIGGHRDHRAVMIDLVPETTYQYRLQGVASDGMIYRSEVRTFTTPPAQTSAEFGRNLAIGADIVDVSSEFSDAFAAANAVDGVLATEWSSRGDGDDAYVSIDLGSVADVRAVNFRTRSMSDGSAITETFTVEAEGQTFGPFPAGDEPSVALFSAQVVTFRVESSTGGNTGAVEVEVYGR